MPTDPNVPPLWKTGHCRNQCRLFKKQRKQTEINQNIPGNKNNDANNSNPNSNVNNNNDNNKNSNRAERKPKTVYPPCETCWKTNHSTEKCYFEPMQPINRLPGTQDRKDRIRSQRERTKATLMKLLKLQLKI